MRFHNGHWVKEKGTEFFSPKEIYYHEIKENVLIFCAPTTFIANRGCVLEGINLTFEVSSPAPEIIRVRTKHHLGVSHKGPDFELNLPARSVLDIKEFRWYVCNSRKLMGLE